MNTEGNNAFFRESFRGFNKEDVAEYIAKLSKDYTSNEEKYREHIVKLTAELKAKTDEINSPQFNGAAAEQRINGLVNESKEKDSKIHEFQTKIERLEQQLQAAQSDARENEQITPETYSAEIAEYKRTVENLSEEIEELKNRCEKQDSENSAAAAEAESAAVNQLSFQLAESESEKLFLFDILKKFIFVLDIESAKNKNINYVADITDTASKAKISEEIEAGLGTLIGFKEKAGELEIENAELKARIEKTQAVISDEQKMYETVTADLGNIIYSAKKSAEEISAKARSESEEIVGEAKLEANSIIDNANLKRAAILEENKKNMAAFREKYGFIKKQHDDMMKKYKEISEIYSLRLLELEDTINTIYNSANENTN